MTFKFMFGDKEVTTYMLMACLQDCRKKVAAAFIGYSKEQVRLQACLLDHLQRKSYDNHAIICQHPELSIESAGQMIPCVLVKMEHRDEELIILGDSGISELCEFMMNFQGINPHELIEWTANQIKANFPNLREDV